MKAMILAAGSGKRMQHLTRDLPKPLITVAGYSLIEHQVMRLAEQGFNELVINVSYLAQKIIHALGDGSRYGVTIQYSFEPEVGGLETGGGILQALPLLGDGSFVVTSADIYTDYPYARLRQCCKQAAHVVLVPNPPYHTAGDFALDKSGLISLEGDKFNYAGSGVVSAELFQNVAARKFSLSSRLIPMIDRQQVSGELYQGTWFNVGTPCQLEALTQHLAKPTCP